MYVITYPKCAIEQPIPHSQEQAVLLNSRSLFIAQYLA